MPIFTSFGIENSSQHSCRPRTLLALISLFIYFYSSMTITVWFHPLMTVQSLCDSSISIQIEICAEYWDTLPRPRLVCHEPGLRSPVTGEFTSKRPVMRSFYVLFDFHLNKRLSKQPRGCWSETPSRSLWRHCNDFYINTNWCACLNEQNKRHFQITIAVKCHSLMRVSGLWNHSIRVYQCKAVISIMLNVSWCGSASKLDGGG